MGEEGGSRGKKKRKDPNVAIGVGGEARQVVAGRSKCSQRLVGCKEG